MSILGDRKPVVRFAPSPTGPTHIGTVRTALFNVLYTEHTGGTAILRIEDTDKERSKKEYEDRLFQDLQWLGLSFKETYRQSERGAIYKKHLEELIDKNLVYHSKEVEVGEGSKVPSGDRPNGGRESVIRFRNPNKTITFTDTLRGDISFDTTELGDFVIAKSLEEPLYHFAVVLDDFLMGVNHIIRGEDHISNTPRQILIQEALGAERPQYTHLPLVLAEDRSKLSKRKHGEMVSIDFYRQEGFLPEAINNYLALLGWNPGGEQELFSFEELVKIFDLDRLHHSGAIFDIQKLRWINRQHLSQKSGEEFLRLAKPFIDQTSLGKLTAPQLERVLPILLERIDTLGDILALEREGELGYFGNSPEYDPALLVWKKGTKESTHKHLEAVHKILEETAPENFSSSENVKSVIWPYAEKNGRGDVLWPLRVALSGKERSPDPFTLVSALEKEETLNRITKAIKQLST